MSSVESAVRGRSAAADGIVRLTLPDGSVREVPAGTTGAAVAESIGPRLAKDALAVKLDGEGARPHAPAHGVGRVRGRHAEAPRRARALPPLDGPPDAQRGQAALPGREDRDRAGDRERLLLRLRSGPAVHAGGPREDRGRDAEGSSPRTTPSSAWRCRRPRPSNLFRARATTSRSRSSTAFPRAVSLSTGRRTSSTSAAGRTSRRREGSASSSSRTPPAPTGRATSGTRCSSASTAPCSSRRRSSTSTSRASRQAQRARPPQARQGAGPLPLPPLGSGVAVLPPEGRDGLQPPRRVHARAVRRSTGTRRS